MIVSSPNVQISHPFECTFVNCSHKFTNFHNLRSHLRIHSQSKPFKCLFPNCDYTVALKPSVLRHILSIHFNVPASLQANVSKKEKQRVIKLYVQVDQDLLDKENAEMASIRVCLKPSCSTRNRQSTSTVSDITTEDEDDKSYLSSLQTTVKPSISK